MNLDALNHRDYLIGGAIIVFIASLLAFGLTLTILFVLVALAGGTTYVYFSEELSRRVSPCPPVAHGQRPRRLSQSHSQNEPQTSLSSRKKWQVTIGREHTRVSSPRGGSQGDIIQHPDTSVESFGQPSPGVSMFNLTWSGTPSAGVGRRAAQAGGGSGRAGGGGGPRLPRVVRVHNSSYNEGGSILFGGGSVTSQRVQRRYPTHQPQYSGLNARPVVHLGKTQRYILNDRNSSMVTSPVTVKVAPPDVLKPPTPSIVPAQPASEPERQHKVNPCDTQTVLSAIREKRKRTMKEEEEVIPIVEKQETKRRRHGTSPLPSVGVVAANDVPNGEPDMDISPGRAVGLKRPAISRAREESICQMENQLPKRSRSEGQRAQGSDRAKGRTRNPIEVSYSSSRGMIDNKNDRSLSESRMNTSTSSAKRVAQLEGSDSKISSKRDRRAMNTSLSSQSLELETTARPGTPRRLISLLDQDAKMTDDKPPEEVEPSTSGQDTVSGAETPDISTIPQVGVKKTLFPLSRDSSSRRRHTPIRGDSNTEFSKVPTLRYSLTVEDYACDRAAEMERVQQMLEEVEEEKDTETVKSNVDINTQPHGSSSSFTLQASAAVTTAAAVTSNTATPAFNFGKLPSSAVVGKTTTSTLAGSAGTSTVSLETSKSGTSVLSSSLSTDHVQKVLGSQAQLPAALSTMTAAASNPLGVASSKSVTSSTNAAPDTSTVNTLLFKHTPTLSTSSLSTGTTQISSTGTPQGAPPQYPGLTAASKSSISSNKQPVTTSSQYSFTPVFGQVASAAAPSTVTNSSAAGLGTRTHSSAAAPSPASFSGGAVQSTFVGSTTASAQAFAFGQQQPTAPSKTAPTTAAPTTAAPTAARSIRFGVAGPAVAASVTQATSVFGSAASTQPAFNMPTVSSASSQSFAFPVAPGSQAVTATTGGSTTNATSNFAFGSQQLSTATPAFNFNTGGTQAFGTVTTATVVAAPTGFGATSAPVTSLFGSTAPSTAAGGFPFTTTSSVSMATTGVFGQQPPTSSQASVFGQSVPAGSAPSVFGQTKTTAAPSFGSSQSQPTQQAATSFQFGATASAKPASTFQFGSPAPSSTQPAAFNFNTPKTTASTGTTGAFTFGKSSSSTQANPGSNTFGTNAFGTSSSMSSPAFGGTSNNAFGTSGTQPSAFGQTTQSSSQNAFNAPVPTQNAFSSAPPAQNAFSSAPPAQNAFSSAPPTQNAFSNSTTHNAFGSSGTVQNAFGVGAPTGGFGGATTATPNKGFDFSGAAGSNKPSISFGGGPSQQPQQESSAFTFGGNNPTPNASFTFGAGNTSFGTPQAGTGTPVFGTPSAAPTGFGQSGTASGGQGSFTVGSGNTLPRPRTMVRAARRRTPKR